MIAGQHWSAATRSERIEAERSVRLAEYREKATGADSAWTRWREGLPDGAALRAASRAGCCDDCHSTHVFEKFQAVPLKRASMPAATAPA